MEHGNTFPGVEILSRSAFENNLYFLLNIQVL
jgi:hypothetical protein